MNSLYCNISGLVRACVNPIGGGAQLFIVRAEDVVSIPSPHSTGNIVVGAVQIKPGTGFLQLHLIADSIKFSSDPEQTPQGERQRFRITGRYPKLDATVSEQMRRMKNGHFVAIFKDYNGEPLLVGTPERPLVFKYSATSGEKRKDKNQYSFEFTGTSPYPAPFMDAAIAPPNESGDSCALITEDDFTTSWTLAADGTLTQIAVDKSGAGNIASILTHPDGSLFDENGSFIDVLNWNGTHYVPSDGAGVHVVNGTWTFEIPSITFTLLDPSGLACEYTLRGTQSNTISLTVANISTAPTSICLGESVALAANAPAALETGIWSGPAETIYAPIASDNNVTISGLPVGVHTLTWTISNGLDSSSDTVQITVNPIPTGQIYETASISAWNATDGELLVVGLDGSASGYTYEWSTTATTNLISGLGPGEYWVIVTDSNGCASEKIYYTLEAPANPSLQYLLLDITVTLSGPYDPITGLMNDNLRTLADFPLTEPYTGLGFTHVNGGGETIEASVLETTGGNAVVDWVFVELRDSADNTNVISTRAALLLSSGKVVDTDGSSFLSIEAAPASYYIAVRHRNHLGVMTSATHALNETTETAIDFKSFGGVSVHGTFAMQEAIYPHRALFAGNTNGDSDVVLAGGTSDVNAISLKVFTHPDNTTFAASFRVPGYHVEDTNLTGEVVLAGANSDVNIISLTVYLHPGNTGRSSTYVVNEQLP